MNKFGLQIERINKIQSPLPISVDKTLLFLIYVSIAFYKQNFLNITQRFCIFVYLFHVVFMDIFYYNTPIYREVVLHFIQFIEKCQVNRTPFHFRRRAEAVLRRAACLRKAFSTACPSMPKNGFIRRSEPCYMKKFWHASAQHSV